MGNTDFTGTSNTPVFKSNLSIRLVGVEFAFRHRNDQVVLRHEAVLGDKESEPPAEVGLGLEDVEDCAVVKVGVRKDAIDASANAAQLSHRTFLQRKPEEHS